MHLRSFFLAKQVFGLFALLPAVFFFWFCCCCCSLLLLLCFLANSSSLPSQYLEAQQGFAVLGSLLSPAHGVTVRERYRTNIKEVIPSPHRLAVAQLLVENSKCGYMCVMVLLL
jgi:hypothetical protein